MKIWLQWALLLTPTAMQSQTEVRPQGNLDCQIARNSNRRERHWKEPSSCYNRWKSARDGGCSLDECSRLRESAQLEFRKEDFPRCRSNCDESSCVSILFQLLTTCTSHWNYSQDYGIGDLFSSLLGSIRALPHRKHSRHFSVHDIHCRTIFWNNNNSAYQRPRGDILCTWLPCQYMDSLFLVAHLQRTLLRLSFWGLSWDFLEVLPWQLELELSQTCIQRRTDAVKSLKFAW